MARITRSIEMSFSASRLLRTDTSMSITILRISLVRPAELDLDLTWSELAVAEDACCAVDFEGHAADIGTDDSAFVAHVRGAYRHRYESPGGAPPVPRLRQRPVDAWRRNLERVRGLAHRVPSVQPRRDLPAHLRDLVQADAAVGIDDDP